MRKLVAAAALAATTLTLAACSGTEEDVVEDTEAEAPAEETTATAETVLDASTVTADQLAGMTVVTPELAEAIIAGQPYENVSAFNEVLMATLTEEEAATVRETLFVPVNLNTASEADIKLIPGMTEKMEYEFLEYRPYENMDEFNREIGKYVDEEEVARFRQYVTL